MTTKDEALNATMADSALERMAENERELGLDYMEPALEPTTKQKVDAAVEQYAKTGNGRVLEAALRNIIINETLDKMAKNARELGLDYEPAQQQEPVARVVGYYAGRCVIEPLGPAAVMPNNMALYIRPQAREPLTDAQIYDMYNEPRSDAEMLEFARAIEAAHGIHALTERGEKK